MRDPLEEQLDKELYDKDSQEYDGVLQYNLPTPKDLSNYYPPTDSGDMEKDKLVDSINQSVLNSQGETPASWLFNLSDEERQFFNEMDVDFQNQMGSIHKNYEFLRESQEDLEYKAKQKTRREKFGIWLQQRLVLGKIPFDYEKEYKENLEELEEERLHDAFDMFETEADSTEILEQEQIPNSTFLGFLGKAWHSVSQNVSQSFKLGTVIGDAAFHDKVNTDIVDLEPDVRRRFNIFTLLAMGGKGLSRAATNAVGEDRTSRIDEGFDEEKIEELEQYAYNQDKQFTSNIANISWENAQEENPWLVDKILNMPFVQGDQNKGKAILLAIAESNSPELAEAGELYRASISEQLENQVRRITTAEDTVGEVLVNGLGWYSKHIVGSIASHVWLLTDDEYRKMASEFDLKSMHERVKEADYSPAKLLGIDGTFIGSMFDLANSFAFDPTIWFFTPYTGVRGGAVRQYASARHIKGFMKSAPGKQISADLWGVLKEGQLHKINKLMGGFNDVSRGRIKNIVRDDIARGLSEPSERFYNAVTDALLRGDMPFNYHKTAFSRMKARTDYHILKKAAKNPNDPKVKSAYKRLFTQTSTSTKVNIAGPRGVQNIRDKVDKLIHSTGLSGKAADEVFSFLDKRISTIFDDAGKHGTGMYGTSIAATKLKIADLSDRISALELLLNFKPRLLIKNIGDDVAQSGNSIRNLALDELGETLYKTEGAALTQKSVNEVLKKQKAKLKTLEKGSEQYVNTEAFIARIQSAFDQGELVSKTGKRAGQTADYHTFDLPPGIAEVPSGQKEFLMQLIDEVDELAKASGATRDMSNLKKEMTKVYDKLDEIGSGGLAGKGVAGTAKLDDYLRGLHHQYHLNLDKQMASLRKELNRSPRADLAEAMHESMNLLVYKLGWHKSEKFFGGWYTLVESAEDIASGSVAYSKAKKVAKGAQKKDKAAVLKDHPEAVWIDNPIQVKYNKNGSFKGMDIDWATLRIMMNFADELESASAILRGQRVLGTKGQRPFTFVDDAGKNRFEILEGRAYTGSYENLVSESTKGIRMFEDAEDAVRINRELLRATNQTVEATLPVSPLEFMVINAEVEGIKAFNIWRSLQANKFAQFANKFQQTWAFEKIMRPATAIVAALDEWLFYKSIYGWKGTAKDYLFNKDVRSIRRQIKKMGGLDNVPVDSPLGKKINTWVADALEKQNQLPIEVAKRYQMTSQMDAPYELLKNTDPGFFQYATQHINTLLDDYGFQQYAQTLKNIKKIKPSKELTQKQIDELIKKGNEDWVNWFKTGDADYIKGIQLYGKPTQAKYIGKKEAVSQHHALVNSEQAWQLYQSQKQMYTLGIKNAQTRDGLWNALIDAAAKRAKGNLKAMPDEKWIGRIRVPGVRQPKGLLGKTWLDKFRAKDTSLMQQMFGDPAWNRSNMIANKAFATRKEQLMALYKDQGKTVIPSRNLTKDMKLASEVVDPRFQSDMFGMSYFDETNFGQGVVTEDYVNALAMDYALQEVDDMMLKFHLTSPLAKELRFLAPFGGPWADFWGRYLNDLGRRSQFRGNWWAFTDEKTAGNFVKRKIYDGLNHIPNVRRYGYMSRIANAELKGSVGDMEVDFSPMTFLPNGDNPMFAINPIGGFIPVIALGLLAEHLDDTQYSEFATGIEELFPSTGFVPPLSKFGDEPLKTTADYLLGGGVLRQSYKSLSPLWELDGQKGPPQPVNDVPTALKYARDENDTLYKDIDIILASGDFPNYEEFLDHVQALGRDARTSAALSLAGESAIRLGVPVNVRISDDYADIANNFIDWSKEANVYESIVSERTRASLERHPYDKELQRQAMREISDWWFDNRNSLEGRATNNNLMRSNPSIIALTLAGYRVTDKGQDDLPEKEMGDKFDSGEIFRPTAPTNRSNFPDYIAEGLITTRMPDDKILEIIYKHSKLDIDAVDIIREKMTELVDADLVEKVEEKFPMALNNPYIQEELGIKFTSTDVSNLEDTPDSILYARYTPEDLGPEITSLLQDVLKGTEYEEPGAGWVGGFIVPYLYAFKKLAQTNPAYMYTGDPNDQTFQKGVNLLHGLTKAAVLWDGENPRELDFLDAFEGKLYELKTLNEQNDISGQKELLEEVYESFTIFNHLIGNLEDFNEQNVISGEQWWNYYVRSTLGFDLEWKTPLPVEGEIKNKSFSVKDEEDGDFQADFQTIEGEKPFRSKLVNASSSEVLDGDTFTNVYSDKDVDSVRIIGIMAEELCLDPNIYPEECSEAIRQKAFLSQFFDRYYGRLYIVTDKRFGNDQHRDPYGRKVGWLFVENGLDGDLADGYGEYVFFSDHFSPADNYYARGEKLGTFKDLQEPATDVGKWDLRNYDDILEIGND